MNLCYKISYIIVYKKYYKKYYYIFNLLNYILPRTKPYATLFITNVTYSPPKIQVNFTNCNENKNFCFNVNYCVRYEGKHIRDKQSAIITLEITDSKKSIQQEIRLKFLKSNHKSEQKTVELKLYQQNCFTNNSAFTLMFNVSRKIIL